MFTQHKYLGRPEYNRTCERLITVANAGGPPISYEEVFEIMGLTPGNYAAKEAGHLLGEISEQMHSEGKPMLSAIVVNRQEGMPGSGFFKLAVQLGKLPRGATRQEERAFWEEELRAVYLTTW
jgi:hypothetical protein